MKNHSYSDSSAEDTGNIRKVTIVGVVISILLAAVELTLGLAGGSQALVADAFHTISDLSTDVVLLIGLKFWTKPPDEDHPYGHRRIETMITWLISLSLLAVGLVIGYTALSTIREKPAAPPGWIAFAGAACVVVVKEILYRWTIAVGQKTKSSAVIARAWHHRSDSLSSVPVAIVIALSAIHPAWSSLDHVAAFVVSIFIVYIGWEFLSTSFMEIIDTGASQKEREQMRTIALTTQGVRSVHALRTRRVGPGWFVDLHIQVDPLLSVRDGHAISGLVKYNLFEKGPDVLDVMVHLEPYEQ